MVHITNDNEDVCQKIFSETEKYEEGFTLAEALKEYPELLKDPVFNEYGFAAESIFEMIAKSLEKETGLIAERNNREDKFAVDFKIINPKTKEILFYCDIEGDRTQAFKESDGKFCHWDLTVPLEKKKYFYRDKPFFYIKYSMDNFKWCYVLDGWASREKFEEVVRIRKGIKRKLWQARSAIIFNKKIPYGIHKCEVQQWLQAISYFVKKRYCQLNLNRFENENKN